MTDLSRQILENYQVRKTKKQKGAFIRLLRQHFPELQIQEGGFPKCKNIVVGDIENAQVILTAHYDTCAQLPFPNFIMPKKPLISILYSVLLVIPFCIAIGLASFFLSFLITDFQTHYWVTMAMYFGLLSLLIAGPANKHTANDNTSGVITLCELMQILTPDLRAKAAFVFFDHEETGLIGSSMFRSKYKTVMKNKLLINFDCVSDGDHILVIANKAARTDFADVLKCSFLPTEEKSILFSKAEKTYYPSDQMGFKKAVAVSALKHHKFLGYYMDRIHTSRDTVFDKTNIKLICDSVLRLLKPL